MPNEKQVYLPILVGAEHNWKPGIAFQRDDAGADNISQKNSNYSELTAMYWAWRNLPNADVVGLVHYRRFLAMKHGKNLDDILTQKQIESLLLENDVILPQKRNYYIETNYSHYIHAHHREPLDKVRSILSDEYPEYVSSFDHVMKKRSAHMFNMFIMKKNVFDDYAKWLFGVLERLEEKIDISEYSVQEARVFGYISELLMDVWIFENKVKFAEVPWMQIGSKHIIKKMVYFVGRKFRFGVNRTHF